MYYYWKIIYKRGKLIMPNKRTRPLTSEEFYILIDTIKSGFTTKAGVNIQPNPQIAMVAIIQANLGLRVSDAITLKLTDIVKEGNLYRLNISEKKTGKKREFPLPAEIYQYIMAYMLENDIKPNQQLFNIGIRAVQKHLKITADYLNWENVGTHSLRKFYCTELYNNNNFNIELCRQLMLHSSVSVTMRYIGIQTKQIEEAISKHICLPSW